MSRNRDRNHLSSLATGFGGIAIAVSVAVFFSSCDREYLPKPLGYNRLELPPASYRSLPDTLPYDFEYSIHAVLLSDTSYVRDKYWIEIYYPAIKSNIHITYKPLNGSQALLKEF